MASCVLCAGQSWIQMRRIHTWLWLWMSSSPFCRSCAWHLESLEDLPWADWSVEVLQALQILSLSFGAREEIAAEIANHWQFVAVFSLHCFKFLEAQHSICQWRHLTRCLQIQACPLPIHHDYKCAACESWQPIPVLFFLVSQSQFPSSGVSVTRSLCPLFWVASKWVHDVWLPAEWTALSAACLWKTEGVVQEIWRPQNF